MRKPSKIREFEKGHEPEGELVELERQPVVLRFPPSAYRAVEPDELEAWHKEVADRLGLTFDIGGGSGGTVTFCKRGGSGAAYRCDCDVDGAGSGRPLEKDPEGRPLRPWDSTPVVLDFPPVAYELVQPERLKDWAGELQKRFGRRFDIGGGSGGTVSFCQRGGSGAAYRCDSDIA
ncbi:hypothetical protein SH611_07305 [Geminicoccaceae bacterium 1502E]|nr:hypothetical protein [Geminicoccaceae bacterium 1502E]